MARARLFLAALSLIVIYLHPTEPIRSAKWAYGLVFAYAIYSLFVLLLVSVSRETSRRSRVAIHAVDVLWATLISLFTQGPNGPFFLFFLFVLVSAAYRWGSRATLITAGAGLAVLAAEAAILVGPAPVRLLEGKFEFNRFLMRAVYLLIMGYLLGYLGDAEKRLQQEASAIARIMTKVRAEAGLQGTLQAVFDDLLVLFDAAEVLLAVRADHTGRVYLWRGARSTDGSTAAVEVSEIDAERQKIYFFPFAGEAWLARARRLREGTSFDLLILDGQGERLRQLPSPLPADLLAAHPFHSILTVSFTWGREGTGRLFLLDPSAERSGEPDLQFLQRLVRQAAPALESVYLMSRLRSRVGAIERSRVARELHDGVIQSLIGLEMRIDALRRGASQPSSGISAELAQIQGLLRQEVLNVRELMEQMKPLAAGPQHALGFLAEYVEKFGRETGIVALFVSDLQEAALPARLWPELARIVQEGLVNVRKHSGAENVLVRLGFEDGSWKLVIDDDGRGFGFSGRLGQAELEASRRGPVVIKERVRSLGGELAIESHPGRGARLEIRLPQQAHAEEGHG